MTRLRQLDYSRFIQYHRNFKLGWQILTYELGFPLEGVDPGKKVRNHFQGIMSYPPVRALFPNELSRLCEYVDYYRLAGGEIHWKQIERQMTKELHYPFSASRLKDEWWNKVGKLAAQQAERI